MGFVSKGIICSCAAGIKTGLTAEPWHAPLHLNSPPRRISVVRGTKTGKANPVQHGQSCQITHTMLGSLYWAQPAQRSILDMHSLFKVHWHSRGDKMQMDAEWWPLGVCSYCGLKHVQCFNPLIQTVWQLPPFKQAWYALSSPLYRERIIPLWSLWEAWKVNVKPFWEVSHSGVRLKRERPRRYIGHINSYVVKNFLG